MLKVSDIMTPNPAIAHLDTKLGEVIGLMKEHACRQLPVVDRRQVVGIITDRDIRLAMNSPLILHERSDDQALLNTATAESCMTAEPVTVDADAPATEAAEIMRKYKFGGLPVLRDGRLVGIVTVSDILNSYIKLLSVPSGENAS